MQASAKRRLTAHGHASEFKPEIRSEFVDGKMFAMAEGTERRPLIGVKVVELSNSPSKRSTPAFPEFQSPSALKPGVLLPNQNSTPRDKQ